MDTTPEPQIRISPMTMDTVEAVALLESRCISPPWSLDALVEELSNPIAVYYTAILDGRLVGYIGMHHIVDEGCINNVAVEPDCRRNGVATLLLGALTSYAKAHGLRTLTLEVRASNDPAIALYSGFGFARVGLRRGYYALPTEDALLMTLEM